MYSTMCQSEERETPPSSCPWRRFPIFFFPGLTKGNISDPRSGLRIFPWTGPFFFFAAYKYAPSEPRIVIIIICPRRCCCFCCCFLSTAWCLLCQNPALNSTPPSPSRQTSSKATTKMAPKCKIILDTDPGMFFLYPVLSNSKKTYVRHRCRRCHGSSPGSQCLSRGA